MTGYIVPVLEHFDGTNGATVYPNDAPGLTFANVPSGVAALTTSSPPLGTAWLAGGSDNSLGGVVGSKTLYVPRQTDFSFEGRGQTPNSVFNGFIFTIGDLSFNPRSFALRYNSAITSAGDIRIFIGGNLMANSAAASISSGTTFTWGVFRIAGAIYLCIDGALQAVFADNGDIGPGIPYIGNCLDQGTLAGIGSSFALNHDEVRVTIGSARQKTFPYTVATSAFVLDSQPGLNKPVLYRKRHEVLYAAAAATTPVVYPPVVTQPLGMRTGKGGRILKARVPLIQAGFPATGITVGLTGVTSTGSVGIVTPTVAPNPTGVSATGSVGTVGVNIAPATLAGQSGTGSVGTVSPSVAPPVAGVSSSGSVGNVTVSVTTGALDPTTGTGSVGQVSAGVPVTGVSATGSVGSLGQTFVTVPLVGVAATGSVTTVSAALSAALNGVLATGSVGSVTAGVSAALAGVLANGTISVPAATNVDVGLSGVTGTGSVGIVTASSSGSTFALSGVSGTGQVGAPGVNVIVGLTGVSGFGTVGTIVSSGGTPTNSGSGITGWPSVARYASVANPDITNRPF